MGFAFPLVGLFIAPIYPLFRMVALPNKLHSSILSCFSALGGTLGSRVVVIYLKQKDRKMPFITLIPMSLLLVSFFILKKTSKS
jgi:uncharacterized membrane protein YsdA (DUF1294 family)